MKTTLVERVRCVLSEAKLPNSFWAEALNTVAYVINLSPIVALDGDVPNRVWFDKDVSYDHLKVFGCKACVHFQKMRGRNWMLKLSNASSLVMVNMGLDIAFVIQLIRNSLEFVMLCSLKIKLLKILTRLRN